MIVNESPHESKDFKGFSASNRCRNLVPFTFDPVTSPFQDFEYDEVVHFSIDLSQQRIIFTTETKEEEERFPNEEF